MLARVLATVHDAERPMCLADLSAAVGIEASALEGMLGTLVSRGRVRASASVSAEPGCVECPFSGGCFSLKDSVATTYAPAPAPDAAPGAVRILR
jgi:hypothetical protein